MMYRTTELTQLKSEAPTCQTVKVRNYMIIFLILIEVLDRNQLNLNLKIYRMKRNNELM